ncbi:hypothetical protein GQ43DRAFT_59111 [Delitschia confertaspora ATCC 74209]|uniref:Zn(2)-C6 fungal-type domain-containing protein n=1 Tax=Delitschia confertaspora ATCC 74209 TaxID=1513339 RepID=A0A9P4JSX9_9PLEO|nr:hypothetical protein GQ43DRAFT_59111 [Delitschia confertaspora ATCC 74209]
MPDTHGLPPAAKPQSTGRQRIISSCLTCRRRKVRCDHGHPSCGACMRGNHICTYATDQGLGLTLAAQPSSSGSGRIGKSASVSTRGPRNTDVHSRLDRLELLLEKAVAAKAIATLPPQARDQARQSAESEYPPSSNAGSPSSHGAGISSDAHDGTLLLEDGQSQFVSSLHFALLAEEIQDIKALLGERGEEDADKSKQANPNSLISLLALGQAQAGVTLEALLPRKPEHCDALLDIYFYNFDPMMKVVHKPTVYRKFRSFIREGVPIAFAIFYAATYSLPPKEVEEKFGERKEDLLQRYEQGVEISLARERFLTTSSLEVLQGFVIWLTCITKEDDMGKAWALLGVALRIAMNQGLHRDPSLFPSGSFDCVTTETRRRLWHHIFYLEYRAAECKGQEPNVSDEDFTTLLPTNVDDENLIEGSSLGLSSYEENKFTGVTFPIVRFISIRTMRKIIQSTYRLERRILASGLHGTSGPDPVLELQNLYTQIKIMIDEMKAEHRKYMKFCSPDNAFQRFALGLASLMEWRAFVVFWLRTPRAYRHAVFSNELRNLIFEKSVNMIETLNGAALDADVAQFRWHIGGHASFQAIMHVVSELRNKEFETPDRPRALRALRMFNVLRENKTGQAWIVIKSIIEKILSENGATTTNQTSASYADATAPTQVQDRYISQAGTFSAPLYVNEIPAYAIQQSYAPPSVQVDYPIPSYNYVMGLEGPDMNVDFDWGYWGEPVNLAPPPMEYPMYLNVHPNPANQ